MTTPQQRPARDQRDGIDRRQFLQLGAGALAATQVPGAAAAAPGPVAPIPTPFPAPLPPFGRTLPDHRVVLRRRADQLVLKFDFWNLDLVTTGGFARLERIKADKNAFVVVHFLPQHVMEEAFYEPTPSASQSDIFPLPDPPDPDPPASGTFDPPPVGHRVAGDSRLAFVVPPAALPISYTPDALMAWNGWVPSVVPTARASQAVAPLRGTAILPVVRAPTVTETALELPWWLQISPHVQTGWVHAPGEVTHNGRTELWHTRLAGKPTGGDVDENDEARKTVRAVWARDPSFSDYLTKNNPPEPADGEDFTQSPIGMPFRTSLSPRDRFDLVVSSADFSHQRSEGGYLPLPVEVEQLMLSSMGAWLDVRGRWKAEPAAGSSGNSLQSWRHIATAGRDHYVRIVRSGLMCPVPFGGSLFKVTERTFRTIGSGTRNDPKRRVAYLIQQYFIVLRQREVILDGPHQRNDGRGFPFSKIRARTLITPILDPPGQQPLGDVDGFGKTKAFVPCVGQHPFRFDMEATDRSGRTVDLHLPLVFVDGTIVTDTTQMDALRTWYNELAVDSEVRAVDMGGQKVATAPPNDPGQPPADPSRTSVEMHRLTMGAEEPMPGSESALAAQGQPLYFPSMAEAEIRFTAAESVLGGPVSAPNSLPVVVLDPKWVTHGFDTDMTRGEVFIRLKDGEQPAKLDFAGNTKGDRAGGVITPNVGITALSRAAGVVGGNPDTYQGGQFKPADFFGGLDANLLGDLQLGQVIDEVIGPDLFTNAAKAAQVIALRTREEAEAVITEFTWRPKLKSFGPFVNSADAGPATLDLSAIITTPKATPTQSTTLVVGELRSFTVKLLEGASAHFLDIEFDRLRFQSETGKKTDVDVEIHEVVFAGPLEFINDLRKYLDFSAGGFSIDVQPDKLVAGFELPIPSIPLGVFSLQNITFTAGTTIPFTGDRIQFRFGFCTADNPFLVSVMIFGGGGFFELTISSSGVDSFQASLEFGVVAALDFGVASGSVSVTAGIYLAIGVISADNPAGKAELTGFIKLKGEVDVLGIISLGIFMKASFTYIPKKAIVRAVIIVEIDVVLYSGSVEIEYEKKFGGSEDPTFGQSLDASQWVAYTGAFAPIGV